MCNTIIIPSLRNTDVRFSGFYCFNFLIWFTQWLHFEILATMMMDFQVMSQFYPSCTQIIAKLEWTPLSSKQFRIDRTWRNNIISKR